MRVAEPYIIFPDGTQVFSRNISSIQILAGAPEDVLIGIGGVLNAFTYTAQDAASAQNIRAQINDILSGASKAEATQLTDPPPAGTGPFTSVTPNTATVDAVYSASIVGAGFLSLGITDIKADDGAGHVYTFELHGTTDTTIAIYHSGMPDEHSFYPAGAYTLYYSSDYGATWTVTDTALTITST